MARTNPLQHIFWDSSQNRLRTAWRLLMQLSLNIGGALVFSRWVIPLSFMNSWPRLALEAVGYPVLFGITLLSVWFAGRFLDRRDWRDFGLTLTQRRWWEDFGAGFVVGFLLIFLFVWTASSLGIIRWTLRYTSGLAGAAFPVAALLSLLSYGSVGFFEELARAYQIRNLYEALHGTRLGVRGAAVAAACGAALVSVAMHSAGMPAFVLFVFVSMSFQGLFYLFTTRTGLITGYHIAWDFSLATVFGIEALSQREFTGLFTPSWTSLVQFTETGVQIADYLPLLWMGLAGALLQGVAWLALLGWVHWRAGGIRVQEEMSQPTPRGGSNPPESQARIGLAEVTRKP